jgi:hypothetical protein
MHIKENLQHASRAAGTILHACFVDVHLINLSIPVKNRRLAFADMMQPLTFRFDIRLAWQAVLTSL